MSALLTLQRADADALERLGITATTPVVGEPTAAKFDNRPTWDNKTGGGGFDKRPSWDNWDNRNFDKSTKK
ncbi:hypothetical protein F4553_005103 [Allocatelliglobosispora scoriae]|uniref:Uncharacterized protein n=1 Tax=Allocatelliglobosispora scoriae TaxID=643052 RepID=A0A841BU45_9ACTN|nr:multiple cyclophane-containing RiPP AmcA [Allocatelliglobosispora scoriae]MBB5871724.1 hypothetical protein [Allocatelliglobosispora scoriae]